MDTKLKKEEFAITNSTKISQWISVTGRIRKNEQDLFNTQLKRLQCETLNELVKDVIAGKIARITEDKQIEIIKTQAQTSGVLTAQSGYYDFYKRVNDDDFHKWLLAITHICRKEHKGYRHCLVDNRCDRYDHNQRMGTNCICAVITCRNSSTKT